MGTACSQSVVVVGNTLEAASRSSSPATSCTTTTGNGAKTLVAPSIWSPFKLTRLEAEELLAQAEPGAFVFSHDIASEYFLSICAGKYVCHHAVVPREHAFYVGARKFSTISEVIDFFKDHPLGETTLTEEYRAEHNATAKVQLKPQNDNQITIFSPPPVRPTQENRVVMAPSYGNEQTEDTKSTYCTNDYDKETGNINVVLYETIKEETLERSLFEDREGNPTIKVGLHTNQASSYPRRLLTREAAFDYISSSSSDREMCATGLSPLISRKTAER